MTPRSLPSLSSREHQGALCWKAWDWQESKGCSTQQQNTEHSLRTSLWMQHNVQLWSPFKCFSSLLCATYSDTNCISTSGTFCQERDNTCPERLPLNRPSSVSQAQPRPETLRLNAHVRAETLPRCYENRDAFGGHGQSWHAEWQWSGQSRLAEQHYSRAVSLWGPPHTHTTKSLLSSKTDET